MTTAPTDKCYTIRVGGMTCASCSARVQKKLDRLEGVEQAHVNLATHLATIRGHNLTEASLRTCIEGAGYEVRAVAADQETLAAVSADEVERPARHRFFAALSMMVPLMGLAMLAHGVAAGVAAQAVLALVLTVGIGLPIHTATLRALRHGSFTMDTLVSAGSLAALAYSLVAWFREDHGQVYFETAGGIITFILLGRALEARAKAGAAKGLTSLLALRPTSARVVTNEQEADVPIEMVCEDDVVRVRPGERIPVDGLIGEGTTTVDESLLTGESMPIDKGIGDTVRAGSVNGTGVIEVRVVARAQESTISRLIGLVQQAQGSRAPIQRIADRVSGVFVPVMFAAAGLTGIGWWLATGDPTRSLMIGISVLVIACPCALGLATPSAVMVGVAMAARAGVVVRDASALESCAGVDVAVLDKTGTITEGKPGVVEVVAREGVDRNEVLELAAALGVVSEHPLGQAAARRAREDGLTFEAAQQVVSLPGRGVRGFVDAQQIDIAATTDGLGAGELSVINVSRELGQTVSVVRKDGEILGWLVFEDALRTGSLEAIQRLDSMGVRVVVASGDHVRAVKSLCSRLGLSEEHVFGGMLPEGKMGLLDSLRQQGHRVAMAGDGINDAPALAAAAVGIAMGTGTDVAHEAAGLSLARSDLRAIADAIWVARQTMRTIKQNLAWAFGYNLLAVPLAAFGLLEHLGGPMIASGAMALSSVTVVLNSVMLGRKRLGGSKQKNRPFGSRCIPATVVPQAQNTSSIPAPSSLGGQAHQQPPWPVR